jgi:hypothetical protein
VSVVLLFAAGSDASDLSERLAARRRRVAGQLEAMTAERERLTGQGALSPLAVAAFRRGELRLEAELRWHEEFEQHIAAALPDLPGAPVALRAVASGPGQAGTGRDAAGPAGGER